MKLKEKLKYLETEVSKVYCEVTDNSTSDPYVSADDIIDQFDKRFKNFAELAKLLADDWDLITAECKSNEDYKKAVLEYLETDGYY